jgi:cytochrome c
MADRFNTIAGWTLFSGIVALGLSSVSAHYFQAGKVEHGTEEEGEGPKQDETPIEALLASADMAKGEAAFKKCMSCHTIDQGGANGLGPNLYGIMGEAMGEGRGGFAFSDALKGKGGKWDWANMNAWLTSPSAFVPGTKMSFAGISDPKERANLMVYLNSKGSNLPLPPVPEKKEGASAEAAAVVGDAAKGQKSFAKCAACHSVTPGGAAGVGPNLAGIVGKGVASGSFAYSDALKGKGGTWDEATMNAWLESPSKFAAGTKMTFAGLSDPQERANVIEYLKTAK